MYNHQEKERGQRAQPARYHTSQITLYDPLPYSSMAYSLIFCTMPQRLTPSAREII
jgi:hypothetical protein